MLGMFERAAGDGFEHGKDVTKTFKIRGFSFLVGSSRALIRLFQELSHSFPVLRREFDLKEIASTFRSERNLQTGKDIGLFIQSRTHANSIPRRTLKGEVISRKSDVG